MLSNFIAFGLPRNGSYHAVMSVTWNEEPIDKLTEKLASYLDKMTDDELAYLVEVLHYDDWLKYAEDRSFASLVSALAILGMSSFALRRGQG